MRRTSVATILPAVSARTARVVRGARGSVGEVSPEAGLVVLNEDGAARHERNLGDERIHYGYRLAGLTASAEAPDEALFG